MIEYYDGEDVKRAAIVGNAKLEDGERVITAEVIDYQGQGDKKPNHFWLHGNVEVKENNRVTTADKGEYHTIPIEGQKDPDSKIVLEGNVFSKDEEQELRANMFRIYSFGKEGPEENKVLLVGDVRFKDKTREGRSDILIYHKYFEVGKPFPIEKITLLGNPEENKKITLHGIDKEIKKLTDEASNEKKDEIDNDKLMNVDVNVDVDTVIDEKIDEIKDTTEKKDIDVNVDKENIDKEKEATEKKDIDVNTDKENTDKEKEATEKKEKTKEEVEKEAKEFINNYFITMNEEEILGRVYLKEYNEEDNFYRVGLGYKVEYIRYEDTKLNQKEENIQFIGDSVVLEQDKKATGYKIIYKGIENKDETNRKIIVMGKAAFEDAKSTEANLVKQDTTKDEKTDKTDKSTDGEKEKSEDTTKDKKDESKANDESESDKPKEKIKEIKKDLKKEADKEVNKEKITAIKKEVNNKKDELVESENIGKLKEAVKTAESSKEDDKNNELKGKKEVKKIAKDKIVDKLKDKYDKMQTIAEELGEYKEYLTPEQFQKLKKIEDFLELKNKYATVEDQTRNVFGEMIVYTSTESKEKKEEIVEMIGSAKAYEGQRVASGELITYMRVTVNDENGKENEDKREEFAILEDGAKVVEVDTEGYERTGTANRIEWYKAKEKETAEFFDDVVLIDDKEFTELNSGYLFYDRIEEYVRAEKDPIVYLKKENAEIESEVLEYFLKDNMAYGKGDVRITQVDNIVVGEEAKYDRARELLTIIGDVVLKQGKSYSSARKAFYNIKTKKLEVVGQGKGYIATGENVEEEGSEETDKKDDEKNKDKKYEETGSLKDSKIEGTGENKETKEADDSNKENKDTEKSIENKEEKTVDDSDKDNTNTKENKVDDKNNNLKQLK